ncbi:MAG: trigger factor [Planctomycetota bacterium]|nr:trigger factor [Planctomycetota bacterium]
MAQATNENIKIEDVGPARKRLTITVPPDVIAEKLTQSMQTLGSETALPGFRKGHVPTRLLERRFGDAVRSETMNQVIADAYATAIEEKEIKPIGEPEPVGSMEDLKIEDGKPLEFSLEVEVVPTFELPSFDGLKIKRPTLDITDEHIQNEIERLKREMGELSEVNDDFIADDRIVGSAVLHKKGEDEPLFENSQVLVVYPKEGEEGRGPVLGLMIDDLEKQLKGKKATDVVTFKTKGPEAHEREDIRGADLEITFTINQCHRITPTTVEDVVEKYGMPGEDILREQITLALEQRRAEEQANAMREQACEQLAKGLEFDLPQNMTEAQSRRQLERFRLDMQSKGVASEEIERHLAESRSISDDEAKSKLKMFFVLQKLAEHFNVEVSEQEINSRIAMIATQRGMRPDRLKTELVQANRITELASQIRDQKAADRLVDEATVTDVTLDEWNAHLESLKSDAGTKAKKSGTTKKKASTSGSKKKTTKKKTTKA